MESIRDSLSGKMCLGASPATREKTSEPFSRAWWEATSPGLKSGDAQVWSLDPKDPPSGESWTLNISDSPSDARGCSLSSILQENVPDTFFLSAKACRGILDRANRRGRTLPETLQKALESVAASSPTEESSKD